MHHYGSYLEMLASLAQGQKNALNAFLFLKDSLSNISWNHFFAMFQSIVDYHSSQQDQTKGVQVPCSSSQFSFGETWSLSQTIFLRETAGLLTFLFSSEDKRNFEISHPN